MSAFFRLLALEVVLHNLRMIRRAQFPKRLIAANSPGIVLLVRALHSALDGFAFGALANDAWELSFEPHLGKGRALAVAAGLARAFAGNPRFSLLAQPDAGGLIPKPRQVIIGVANDSRAASLLAILRGTTDGRRAEAANLHIGSSLECAS